MLNRPHRLELGLIVVCSAALSLFSLLPVADVRIGNSTTTLRLTDLLGVGYLLAIIVPLVAALAAFEAMYLKRPAQIAAALFGMLGLWTLMLVITFEGVSRLIPSSLLPPTVRRFAIGLGVRPTVWLSLVLMVTLSLSALGLALPLARRVLRNNSESLGTFLRRLFWGIVTVFGVVLVGFGRSMPLAHVSWGTGGLAVDVDTWALPWLGPFSLIVLLVLAVAASCIALGVRPIWSGSAGAGAAWIIAAVSAVVIATSGLTVETGLVQWAASKTHRLGVPGDAQVIQGAGGWLMFVGACLAGIGFAAQLAQRPEERL